MDSMDQNANGKEVENGKETGENKFQQIQEL